MDEIIKLVAEKKLDDPPFFIGKFVPRIEAGCLVASGTPLHAFINTFSAVYSVQYVKQVTPFNSVELERWLWTPLGATVVNKLSADKKEIAWAGGVPRSLVIAGRMIRNSAWLSWSASKILHRRELGERLEMFVQESHPDDVKTLVKTCDAMFLNFGPRSEAPGFDTTLLSTSLFFVEDPVAQFL